MDWWTGMNSCTSAGTMGDMNQIEAAIFDPWINCDDLDLGSILHQAGVSSGSPTSSSTTLSTTSTNQTILAQQHHLHHQQHAHLSHPHSHQLHHFHHNQLNLMTQPQQQQQHIIPVLMPISCESSSSSSSSSTSSARAGDTRTTATVTMTPVSDEHTNTTNTPQDGSKQFLSPLSQQEKKSQMAFNPINNCNNNTFTPRSSNYNQPQHQSHIHQPQATCSSASPTNVSSLSSSLESSPANASNITSANQAPTNYLSPSPPSGSILTTDSEQQQQQRDSSHNRTEIYKYLDCCNSSQSIDQETNGSQQQQHEYQVEAGGENQNYKEDPRNLHQIMNEREIDDNDNYTEQQHLYQASSSEVEPQDGCSLQLGHYPPRTTATTNMGMAATSPMVSINSSSSSNCSISAASSVSSSSKNQANNNTNGGSSISNGLGSHENNPTVVTGPVKTAAPKARRCRHITDYVLAEEEKRLLIKEGYTDFPMTCQSRPLSKNEEKILRKIRRKIRNKKSAQCSRQRKKEYVEDLERKYAAVIRENEELKQLLDKMHQSRQFQHHQQHKSQLHNEQHRSQQHQLHMQQQQQQQNDGLLLDWRDLFPATASTKLAQQAANVYN